ncbi:glycosyltransferase family 4 protein [Bradyrhizobium sp. USDA 4504]
MASSPQHELGASQHDFGADESEPYVITPPQKFVLFLARCKLFGKRIAEYVPGLERVSRWMSGDEISTPMAAMFSDSDIVRRVLLCGHFDHAYYAQGAGIEFASDIEAAAHYVRVGERQNCQPSGSFDPFVYRVSYPDLATWSLPLLLHFADYGANEGRVATFDVCSVLRWDMGEQEYVVDRPTLLLCAHEASMTGAPILAANIARRLIGQTNVIILCLGGGALLSEFRKNSHLVISPELGVIRDVHPALISQRLLGPLAEKYDINYLLANSVETASIVHGADLKNIPTVTLIHEFAEYIRPLDRVRDVIDHSARVVFSSKLTRESAQTAYPAGDFGRSLILVQGKCDVPEVEGKAASLELEPFLEDVKRREQFLVIGCGYVQMRKGVDLFVSSADRVVRALGPGKVRFLWVGDGYDPEHDFHLSIWLRDQIKRSNLDDIVTLIPALGPEDLAQLYRAANAMFISSRLDPFPNVSIDAIHAGLPIVCFEKATGVAEFIAGEEGLDLLVVPYLDTDAAASALCRIATDQSLQREIGRRFENIAARAFDMETYVIRLRQILDEAVAGHRRPQLT